MNKRTYRFECGEGDAERLQKLSDYLKGKLDEVVKEHGPLGDERLILMAAFLVADELFDARADIDSLLDEQTEQLKAIAPLKSESAPPVSKGELVVRKPGG